MSLLTFPGRCWQGSQARAAKGSTHTIAAREEPFDEETLEFVYVARKS